MSSSFGFYVFLLVAIIVGVIVVKKITSCLFRTVIALAVLAALAFVYFTFFS